MIIVDTSVLINFFKGETDSKTELFRNILHEQIPFAISQLTFLEILQGARNKSEWNLLEKYLSQLKIIPLPEKYHVNGAKLYYNLRRKGISIRSTIDILIAMTAIDNKYYLLHNDKDFDNIAEIISELQILSS